MTHGRQDEWYGIARSLEQWMASKDFAGHDPHDWLNSPIVSRLTFGSRWISAAWTQVGKRSPVNIRPLPGGTVALRRGIGHHTGIIGGTCGARSPNCSRGAITNPYQDAESVARTPKKMSGP